MKKKYLLHIGAHKTGTTSIQQYMHDNNTNIVKRGIYYPAHDLINKHPNDFENINIFNHSFIACWLRTKRTEILEKFFSAIESEAESLGCSTILISGEDICGLRIEEIRLLKEVLNNNDISIIFYYKQKVNHYRSQLKHHLRSAEYYVTYNSFKNEMSQYDPYEVIKNWKDVFGDIGFFEIQYEKINDSLEEFLKFLGLPINNLRTYRENISFDITTALIINQFKNYYFFDEQILYRSYQDAFIKSDVKFERTEDLIISELLDKPVEKNNYYLKNNEAHVLKGYIVALTKFLENLNKEI